MTPTPRFAPAIEPSPEVSGPALWFTFRDDKLLVLDDGESVCVPLLAAPAELNLADVQPHFLGLFEGRACFTCEVGPEWTLPDHARFEGLRGLFGRLDDEVFAIAGRASQIVTWDRTHRFCGQCGTPTEPLAGERARKCPRCGLTAYPRISPAVIVLITRGDEVLLARGRNFPDAFYSTPAGFVEPGETLETAVERELHEELGIAVKDIRYFGSQSWPFPHQMMVGFTCTWASGEIRIDEHELADARWFRRDAMPRIPQPISISRRLIDSYLHNISS